MATRAEKTLTEVAKTLAQRFARRYGSLKSVLSAGIVAFSKLTPIEREKMLDEANGLQPEDPSEQAATSARYLIKTLKSLDKKQQAITMQFLDDEESRVINDMLNAMNPEIQAARQRRQKPAKTG